MKNFFLFDEMLTPKIITLVYWFSLAAALIGGYVTMDSYYGFTGESVFQGLMVFFGGVISARVGCELLIVIFKIHENLKKLADQEVE